MHSRRARPTLRMLTEDLTTDWESPVPLRELADGNLAGLHPLSELPHPIITKAAESFPPDDRGDNFVGTITGSKDLRLLEVKVGQWRGGVWQDPGTAVHWLIVAGLAKSEHQDHDDFYVRIERANDAGRQTQWLPTEADRRLLNQETAARLVTEWELELQQQMLGALRAVRNGGEARGSIAHPHPEKAQLARFVLTVVQVRNEDYEADEIELEIRPARALAGSNLLWQAAIRALISLNPPEQDWDRDRDSFMTIVEPGALDARVGELQRLVAEGKLAATSR